MTCDQFEDVFVFKLHLAVYKFRAAVKTKDVFHCTRWITYYGYISLCPDVPGRALGHTSHAAISPVLSNLSRLMSSDVAGTEDLALFGVFPLYVCDFLC